MLKLLLLSFKQAASNVIVRFSNSYLYIHLIYKRKQQKIGHFAARHNTEFMQPTKYLDNIFYSK